MKRIIAFALAAMLCGCSTEPSHDILNRSMPDHGARVTSMRLVPAFSLTGMNQWDITCTSRPSTPPTYIDSIVTKEGVPGSDQAVLNSQNLSEGLRGYVFWDYGPGTQSYRDCVKLVSWSIRHISGVTIGLSSTGAQTGTVSRLSSGTGQSEVYGQAAQKVDSIHVIQDN